MKKRFRGYQFIFMMTLFLAALIAGVFSQRAYAAKNKATTIRLVRTEGTVTIKNSKDEEQVQTEEMRLYSGDHQITESASYAWLSLDDTKAVKLDENSETELRKKWFKLEVLLDSGSVFFNVTVPLAKEETLNIRTSTMITGVRGTCGWVRVMDGGDTRVYLLEGKLECLVTNPMNGDSKTITLNPGQYADFYVFDENHPGDLTQIVPNSFGREDIEPYVLVELLGDTELVNKIYEQSGIDLRNLKMDDIEKKILEVQEAKAAVKQGIRGKAVDQDGIVSKDPVWDENGNGDNDVVYLTMPQTATTVQHFLDAKNVKKVVLLPGDVTPQENTLKIDIAFDTPAGKTLEAREGVPVTVLEENSFVVDGTSVFQDLLTNQGILTVNSANTLDARSKVINHGILENTATGHIVLGDQLISDGVLKNAGLIEQAKNSSGDSLIVINGGDFQITDGKIFATDYKTVLEVKQGLQTMLNLEGGSISNDKKGGTTISVSTDDFKVSAMGTDVSGVTDTILGEKVELSAYEAATVWRTDGKYHLIALSKVDSYPVVVVHTEHGVIMAPERVEVGANVPLSAIADDGYELERLEVKLYENNKAGALVGLSENLSFVMPRSNVIISGSFKKIGENVANNGEENEEGYTVNVQTISHGMVKASVSKAKEQENIELSVTPEVGYEFRSITVKTASGKEIGVSAGDDGFEFTMPAENVSISASFEAKKYAVTFYDANGATVLSKQEVAYGSVPVYSGSMPQKGSTKQFNYSFAGWKNDQGQSYGLNIPLPAVTGEESYVALYKETQITYSVTWKNEDGSVLRKDVGVPAGTIPSYGNLMPAKASDAKYSYTFKAWTDEKSNYNAGSSLPELTTDVTYRALYIGTVNQYEVTFVNEDGTVILQPATRYDYGTAGTLITKPAEPTKAANAQEEYIFRGWSDGVATYSSANIPTVTGNVTYKAAFDAMARKYHVTFVDDDGTVLRAQTEYAYGTAGKDITRPAAPVKASTTQYDYTFSGWTDGTNTYLPGLGGAEVTGDVTYKAVYANALRSYGVTFVDYDGTVLLAEKVYDFGTSVADIEKPKDPTRASDGTYVYTFTGWTPAITAVSDTITYTATYSTDDVVHVTSVAINERRTGLTLAIGGMTTGSLSATVLPADATNKNVTWSVDDPSILSVSGTGSNASVTALKSGVANVTVTSEDGLKTDTMQVTVNAKVMGISLDKTAATVKLGKAETLTATITPLDATNQRVIWSSDDDTVATVAADANDSLKANITPLKIGTAKITATTVDGSFTANCNITVEGYTVTFQNNDAANTVLKTFTGLAYGDRPSYGNGTPDKAATAQYTYTFDGWTDGTNPYRISEGVTTLPQVTEDVTYTALYHQTVNEYTVTWLNEDDSVLETDTNVPYGTPASYDGGVPDKKGDAQYSYVFAGWNKTVASVTGDETIKATFTQVLNKYAVTWKNYDDTILEEDAEVPYGDMPSYDSTIPTRLADAEYTYTFSAWTPVVTSVTGNVTYTATYTATKNQYTVKFQDDDGTIISSASYEYGTPAASILEPAAPKKADTVQYNYTFKGWTPRIENVTGNATYTAQYVENLNQYTVTFVQMDDKGNATVLSSAKYDYGTGAKLIVLPPAPNKASTVSTDYYFSGYTPAISDVTGDVTYTATFVDLTRQYTITFNDENGTTLSSTQYDYGTLAADIAAPTGMAKAEDAGYTYAFAGWDTTISDVTGDATYTATYKATARNYNVTLDLNMVTAVPTINSGNVTSYTYGVGATLPTDVTLTGYRFGGWYESVKPTNVDQPVTAIAADATGDKTYYAKWDALYQITWDLKLITNGVISPNVTEAIEGEGITIAVTPDKGYKLNSLTYVIAGAVAATDILPDTNGIYGFNMPADNVTLNAVFAPKAISGTLGITGKQQVNETLTATVTGGSNAGTLSYQWQRDGVDITGATGETYTLVAIDYNTIIKCVVTSSIETGTLEESTKTIAPAATISLILGTDTVDVATINALFADANNSVVELKPGADTTQNIFTVDGDLTIPAGKTLVVDEGVVVTIGGGNVTGQIINLSKNSIHNSGILMIAENGVLTNGDETQEGTIVNEEGGFILIKGKLDHVNGTITNLGKIYYREMNAAEDGADISAVITDETAKDGMLPAKAFGPAGTKAVYVITKDAEHSTAAETNYQVEFVGNGAIQDEELRVVTPTTYTCFWTMDVPKNISYLTKATVGDDITALAKKQFAMCTNLVSVTLPSGITELPYGLFYGCSSLTSFEIPSSVTTIGEQAFSETGLKSVSIPVNVVNMGNAFSDCPALTQVTIENGVETISSNAFYGCNDLTTVSFPDSLKRIEDYAFGNTGIQTLRLPGNLEEVGIEAFYNSKQLLKTIYLPKSLKTIGSGAFDRTDFTTDYDGIAFYYDGTEDEWFKLKYENDWHTISSDEYNPGDTYFPEGRTRELMPIFTNRVEDHTQRKVSLVVRGLADEDQEKYQFYPGLGLEINSYNVTEIDKVEFGTWIHFGGIYSQVYSSEDNYSDHYKGFRFRITKVNQGTDLYHVGFDAGHERGAFMMPDDDVLVEIIVIPDSDDSVFVTNKGEFLNAINQGKKNVTLRYEPIDIQNTDCTELVIPSGTTVCLFDAGLNLGEGVTMTIEEGAALYNYQHINVAEGATLVINGEFHNYCHNTLENKGTIVIGEQGKFYNGNADEGQGRLINHENGVVISRGVFVNAEGSIIENEGIIRREKAKKLVFVKSEIMRIRK